MPMRKKGKHQRHADQRSDTRRKKKAKAGKSRSWSSLIVSEILGEYLGSTCTFEICT